MQKSFLVLWLAISLSACGTEVNFDFGSMPVGTTPTNFHSALAGGGAPGEWKIIENAAPSAFAPLTDKATVNHQAVLAQLSQDMTDEHFPMFVYDGQIFRDFKFTTKFEIISGVTEQMAGVVFRFQNSSNFYVARASALGKNLRFYKVVDGARSDPIGPSLEITTNVWHTLAVKCEGNQISIWLDDQLAMPALGDNTFTQGKVGFWTKSDAVSYFADANVNYTPLIPLAQTLVNSVMEKMPRILSLRIYMTDTNGVARVVASDKKNEIGKLGTDAEKNAIGNGGVFFGRDRGTMILTMPLRDRNGDSIAAMRVELKSFFGETQDNALARAMIVRNKLEELGAAAEDLNQ